MHRLDDSVRYVLDQKKSSRAGSLREAVGYALNRDKTEQDLFESAIGCTLETAFADMRRVKKMWHKEDEVQGFHLVQSFAPGESTPEQAHQIGLELAENLLDGRFQAVIATHLNTGHLHNHIVWNSVSMVDGKKYRSNAKTYITQVRRISDELCRKYYLSVIDTQKSEKVARPYVQWLAEQNGKPTWKTPIRQDVDAAVLAAFTWNQFVRELEKKDEKDSCIHYMRALAIGRSIQSAVDSFMKHEEELLQGSMDQSLIDRSELAGPLNGLYRYAIENVYQAREVIEVEAMGYKVLGELIDFFMEWVNHPSSGQSKKVAIMLQGTGLPKDDEGKDARLAHMLDYISGMTDSFALETYRKLTGIL